MWARVVTLLLGIWLMIAPALFDYGKQIANNGHIVGPLMITFSIIALSECTRNVRLFILPLGAWLLFAPWILDYENTTAFASDYSVGVAALLLSLVKAKTKNTFDGGWPVLWR
jgi:hypothetical protein